jgi:RNA-binding protein YlmH
MAAFIPDILYDPDWTYPIVCVRITPRSAKFAEKLSHRDILGALMNLGIERDRTGDIAICDTEAYLFCSRSLSEMICRELTRIRHTSVSCEVCDLEAFSYTPKTERIRGSVASVRLDAVMALAFTGSRSTLVSLIEEGKVFINGKLITTNAYALKDGDLISVRGMGKFRYNEVLGQTKKGRCMIEIEKYI